MKSYYEFHEQAYQGIKAKGYISWDKAKDISQILDYKTSSFLDETISTHFATVNKMKALDLGCGTGTTSFYFAKKGFNVTGVDISATAIDMAQSLADKQNLNVDFKVVDVLHLESLNQKFDIIYDSHCLHCIVFNEDRHKVLTGVKEILSRDGIFVLDTMVFSEKMDLLDENSNFLRFDDNYILWHQAKYFNIRGVVKHDDLYWCAQRSIKPAQTVLEEVRNCGFKIISQSLDVQGPKEPSMLRLVLK